MRKAQGRPLSLTGNLYARWDFSRSELVQTGLSSPLVVSSMSMGAGVTTLVTTTTHGLSVNDRVVVSEIATQPLKNNGLFNVSQIVNTTTFRYLHNGTAVSNSSTNEGITSLLTDANIRIPDISGNNHDMIVPSGGQAVFPGANQVGGRPTLFTDDGNTDFPGCVIMETANTLTQPYTLHMVSYPETAAFQVYYSDYDDAKPVFFQLFAIDFVDAGIQQGLALGDLNPHVDSFRFDGTSSRFVRNGAVASATSFGTEDLDRLLLGSQTNGTRQSQTNYCEIVIYETAQSNDDMDIVQDYLRGKWDI